MLKRLLSTILVICLVISVAPMSVFAVSDEQRTITLEANGGTLVGIDGNTIRTGPDGMVSEQPIARKDGYYLVSWYTDATYDTLVDFGERFQSDTTIYALWNKAPQYTISGKVVDADGNGLEQCTVTVENDKPTGDPDRVWMQVYTDSTNGTYTISGITGNQNINVSTYKEGYVTKSSNFYLTTNLTNVDFSIVPRDDSETDPGETPSTPSRSGNNEPSPSEIAASETKSGVSDAVSNLNGVKDSLTALTGGLLIAEAGTASATQLEDICKKAGLKTIVVETNGKKSVVPAVTVPLTKMSGRLSYVINDMLVGTGIYLEFEGSHGKTYIIPSSALTKSGANRIFFTESYLVKLAINI